MQKDIAAEIAAQPSDEVLNADAKAAVERFNILIAGNTGVGKSTLLNTVFGVEDEAPTGTGKPQTMEIREYVVPGKPLKLFDTRGFETGDKEAIDQVWAKLDQTAKSKDAGAHIHIAWLCISSSSSRIEPAHQDFLKRLAERKIPCIVVLTKSSGDSMLDVAKQEAQPSASVVEVLAVPQKLRNGGETEAFGVDDLVTETYRLAPKGVKAAFVAAQRANIELKSTEALNIVRRAALTAGGAGVLPLADIPAIWFIQRRMRADIDQLFEIDHTHPSTAIFRNANAGNIVSAIGTAVRQFVLKVLPEAVLKISGVGTLAAMAAAGVSSGAATEALGRAYVTAIVRHFETGKTLFPDRALSPVLELMVKAATAAMAARKPAIV